MSMHIHFNIVYVLISRYAKFSNVVYITVIYLGTTYMLNGLNKQELSLQEKIGQLFLVPAAPCNEEESLFETTTTYHVGSILTK